MSFDWLNWAKGQRGLRPPEQFVLLLIADFYNDKKGYAWPSQETLAEISGYNRSTIHRACKSLQAKGLISWEKDMRSSGHFSSNRYKLHRVAFSHTAECIEAEEEITVLQKASPPCGMEQQKPVAEPLDLSLNIQEVEKAHKVLSESQRKLAEMWASKLVSKVPGQFYVLSEVIKDCEKFLSSDQTDENWSALGNGLPNPRDV